MVQKCVTHAKTRQVLGLFSVNLVGIPIGIFTSVAITRYLGPKGYGDYKFISGIFSLAVIIFTFGFFQAGNRALVLNNNNQKAKEYYGTVLAITAGLFVVMSIFLMLYALFDSNIQEKQLVNIFLFLIPFGWVFLLLRYFETLLQADNRIRLLAMIRLYPKVGLLVIAGLFYFFLRDKELNRLAIVWSGFLVTQMVVYILVLFKLQISCLNIKRHLIEIWNYNKSFGLNVYVGSLCAVGFMQLTGIIISYFGKDNSGVGYYTLALTISMPLSLIPNTIATTHYKEFSVSERIPKKLFLITLGLSLGALVCLWALVAPFVHFFYGKEFEPVIMLNFIVSFGVIAHGLSDFFNRFLGANGQGKALRNSSFLVGGSMLLFSFLLIPRWGEYGAAYAKLIAGFVYLCVIVWHYIKYVNREKAIQVVRAK
jgi:O-antigen/teichoic acid export membrane protein